MREIFFVLLFIIHKLMSKMNQVSSISTRVTKFGSDFGFDPEKPVECDEKDYIRWKNCMERDFTING